MCDLSLSAFLLSFLLFVVPGRGKPDNHCKIQCVRQEGGNVNVNWN